MKNPTAREQQLASYFYEATLFLKDQIENHGWQKFSSNYLREHVRCRFGETFTNSLSPTLLDIVREQHPELRRFIEVNARKEKGLFE
jgi:hypothetical protein